MFGTVDPPTIPFTEGEIMGELPQSGKEKSFVQQDLDNRSKEGIYELLSGSEAEHLVSTGHVISYSFVL